MAEDSEANSKELNNGLIKLPGPRSLKGILLF